MTADERFDRIDRSIADLTGSVGTLARDVETLTRYVLDFRQEAAGRFQTIENRLDVVAATMASLDSRHPALT
jgi:hypothetical protein